MKLQLKLKPKLKRKLLPTCLLGQLWLTATGNQTRQGQMPLHMNTRVGQSDRAAAAAAQQKGIREAKRNYFYSRLANKVSNFYDDALN